MATKYMHINVKKETYDLFKSCYEEFLKQNPQCEIFRNKLTEDDIIKRICEYYLEN